ncbi:hypothetical protein [Schaalia sp. lx-260]|uniref:hypothetical protein n=1 Tax=Schaalia sp. lx-260 TaxID=2899082 RepID=UPI001E28C05F|nr:hypothetical protein [Schaalia sp. lx-260]MCD4549151.1 hypothetical protein [Schaalia sp. lx-260]
MEAQLHSDNNTAEIQALRDDLASPSSPRLDGLPGAKDPHAGENRLAATLDAISMIERRQEAARQYMDWFLPAWAALSEDDRYTLENFFLGQGSQDERVAVIEAQFCIQRDSVYRRKNRAVDRLATALYGRI